MASDRVALTRLVKEANDIVAVVGSYLTLHPSGPIFKALCPFHNDSRPSLDVDPRRQRYRCWSCGKFGDVFTFVQEFEKVGFLEARAILANRAGIKLDEDTSAADSRRPLLDVVQWAQHVYHECLLESASAEQARLYLGERKLAGSTVRAFGLGFAPLQGDWLVALGKQQRVPHEILREVGLIAERTNGEGFYDRFRDRVMFPIRNIRGETVGFGGRILPASPYATRAPKYYNSTETPLFNKSELLYGLDLARSAGQSAGYLAVVEGYTDVLMAHQMGIPQVVATMGTALNAMHVRRLRRYVPRVVLVYDADEGGTTGVDRALEIFLSEDVDLQIATLPDGLDPCDLLVAHGPEPFKKALAEATDALDYKLDRLLAKEQSQGVEGKRRIVDAVLGILALAPEVVGQAGQLKRELVITRIASRVGLRQETIWARLGELRDGIKRQARPAETRSTPPNDTRAGAPTAGPAAPEERELLEVLLADPGLVPQAFAELSPEEVVHPGLRKLLDGLYSLHKAGEPPDLDGLRVILHHPALATKALELQEVGRMHPDRPGWLRRIIAVFRDRRLKQERSVLRDRLSNVADHASALEYLRQMQSKP